MGHASRGTEGILMHCFVIDKPEGIGSTAVVSRLKRALKIKRVGHGGTLDPFASGVLPVASGQATRLLPYLVGKTKTYHFQITWGRDTTTQDLTGDVVRTSRHRPCEADLRAALPHFQGALMQTPPAFSALRVQGKRAYTLARQGQEVHLEARAIRIDHLELHAAQEDTVTLVVTCSKGTYVRTLGQDLAHFLGTCGHVSALRRVAVGPLSLGDAVPLDLAVEMVQDGRLEEVCLHPSRWLDDILASVVDPEDARKLRLGQAICPHEGIPQDTEVVACYAERGSLVALVRLVEGKLQPITVFNDVPGDVYDGGMGCRSLSLAKPS